MFLLLQTITHSAGGLYDAMYKVYRQFFRAEGLMSAAGWDGPATDVLNTFFAERFMIVVPPELQNLVFPFLPELQRVVESLGSQASLSMTASVTVFKYLAIVTVQDAAGGLVLDFPEHDVHRLLIGSPVFR